MLLILQAARRNKGLSRRQAALQIGVSYDTLTKAERGDSISESSRAKIARFVGCRATDIWPVSTDGAWDGVGRRDGRG